jgi:hypothetical protein
LLRTKSYPWKVGHFCEVLQASRADHDFYVGVWVAHCVPGDVQVHVTIWLNVGLAQNLRVAYQIHSKATGILRLDVGEFSSQRNHFRLHGYFPFLGANS